MYLPIIQNIIHGQLRPNHINDKEFFMNATKAFISLPEKLSDIENLFISKFPSITFDFESEHPYPIKDVAADDYTKINEDALLKHLDLPIPRPLSPKEKFYQVIVDAEIRRVKLSIVDFAIKQRSDTDTHRIVTDTLMQVLNYSKSVNAAEEAVFSTLQTQLVCFYVELVSLASPILNDYDYYSFENLMYEVKGEFPSDEELNLYNNFCNPVIQTENKESVEKQIVESSPEIQHLKTKYDTFMSVVQLYNFFELPKLKVLSTEKQYELLTKLVSDVPYAIAMLEFLEYPQYLKDNYDGMHTKESVYRHIAKALGKKPDTIKGQFLAYHKPNSGKAVSYTSYQFIEKVQNDYENLLCK